MQGSKALFWNGGGRHFNRYTEPVRRAIFSARYEASRYGSEEVNDVQLLPGVLKADQALASRLEGFGFTDATIRGQLVPTGKTVATSVDLPLSSLAKQVLMFSTEEADRAGATKIKPSHLLTAIARVESGRAARMLAASGLMNSCGTSTRVVKAIGYPRAAPIRCCATSRGFCSRLIPASSRHRLRQPRKWGAMLRGS